jgi:hypothetical protein
MKNEIPRTMILLGAGKFSKLKIKRVVFRNGVLDEWGR